VAFSPSAPPIVTDLAGASVVVAVLLLVLLSNGVLKVSLWQPSRVGP